MRMVRILTILLTVATSSAAPKLVQRADGLLYDKSSSKPFTGTDALNFPTGEKKSAINYLNGRHHGQAAHWYRNGNRQSQFQYANGQLHGISTYWYEDGQLQYQATHQQGRPHGRAVDWWPNGKPSSEEHYQNGRKHGLWRAWWPDGKRSEESLWQNGVRVRVTRWDKDGDLRLPELARPDSDLALLTPNPAAFAKRVPWTIGGARNAIDKIYPGKPVNIVRAVFGMPDEATPEAWIYRGLKITNPTTKREFSRVRFEFKNGQVIKVTVFNN